MAINYCEKHHFWYDMDYETECKHCVDEQIEIDEIKQQRNETY